MITCRPSFFFSFFVEKKDKETQPQPYSLLPTGLFIVLLNRPHSCDISTLVKKWTLRIFFFSFFQVFLIESGTESPDSWSSIWTQRNQAPYLAAKCKESEFHIYILAYGSHSSVLHLITPIIHSRIFHLVSLWIFFARFKQKVWCNVLLFSSTCFIPPNMFLYSYRYIAI